MEVAHLHFTIFLSNLILHTCKIMFFLVCPCIHAGRFFNKNQCQNQNQPLEHGLKWRQCFPLDVLDWPSTLPRPPSASRGPRGPETRPPGSRCRLTRPSGLRSRSLLTPWHRWLPPADVLLQEFSTNFYQMCAIEIFFFVFSLRSPFSARSHR